MQVFYVDEAGCTGALPSAVSPIQPVFVLGGVILHQGSLRDFTLDWLHLKDRFFPNLQLPNSDFLDWIAVEIKGADLRRRIRENRRDPRRQALGFMDKFLDLMEKYGVRLLARLYVKPIGTPFNGRSVYTSAVQSLASDFQCYLDATNTSGLMIMDSRNKPKNTNVSHSVFTQKFRAAGDAYAGLMETPIDFRADNGGSCGSKTTGSGIGQPARR